MRLHRILICLTCLIPHTGFCFVFGAKTSAPLSLESEDGIECQNKESTCVAKGNVVVTQGKNSLHANQLKVTFEKAAGGSTDDPLTLMSKGLKTLEATGSVFLKGPQGEARGDHGTYTTTTGCVVLEGRSGVTLKTPKDKLSTSGPLTYCSPVKGNPWAETSSRSIINTPQEQLEADTLKARFSKNSSLESVLGRGNVRVLTKSGLLLADEATYDGKTKKIYVSGNVKITQGKNQLEGSKGTYDLVTHKGEIQGSSGVPSKTGRVSALIIPNKIQTVKK